MWTTPTNPNHLYIAYVTICSTLYCWLLTRKAAVLKGVWIEFCGRVYIATSTSFYCNGISSLLFITACNSIETSAYLNSPKTPILIRNNRFQKESIVVTSPSILQYLKYNHLTRTTFCFLRHLSVFFVRQMTNVFHIFSTRFPRP